MKINSISISRRSTYEIKDGDRSEFKAKICVNGDQDWQPSIAITLREEELAPIIAIVSASVTRNMTDATAAFCEEVQASLAGPIVEQEQIEDATRVEDTESDDAVPL